MHVVPQCLAEAAQGVGLVADRPDLQRVLAPASALLLQQVLDLADVDFDPRLALLFLAQLALPAVQPVLRFRLEAQKPVGDVERAWEVVAARGLRVQLLAFVQPEERRHTPVGGDADFRNERDGIRV